MATKTFLECICIFWPFWSIQVTTGYYSLLQVSTVITVTAVTTFTAVTLVNTVTAVTNACTLCLGLSLHYHELCSQILSKGKFRPKENFVRRRIMLV